MHTYARLSLSLACGEFRKNFFLVWNNVPRSTFFEISSVIIP